MTWWAMRRARRVLPNERCGQGSGHKRHVREDGRSYSDHRGELVYCEGVPISKDERFERKLRRELGQS